jgi:sarcosine oxidase subunit alpha
VPAYEGDTLGSALFAAGQRIFSRSFKYHRPRGLLCCSGHCPNCMMTVDGVPNVRICVEPARPGAHVVPQNFRGSLENDLTAVVDKVGGPFTPVGFYYRTMIRPRRAWPLFEKFLRSMAGLGAVDPHAVRTRRFDSEHRHVDTLVIGGGRSGRDAARAAAPRGSVLLVEESLEPLGPVPGVEVLQPARALGIYEDNLVPVDAGSLLVRVRAGKIVVATGALEQPLVFPGNDLVGIVLPQAIRRMVGSWSLRAGKRAVVIAADDDDLDVVPLLWAGGTEVARVVDLREEPVETLAAEGRRGHLARLVIDGEAVSCDLAVVSGTKQPAYSLLAQAGARVEYDPARSIFVPTSLPAGIEAVGGAAGDLAPAAVPATSYGGGGDKCFACICEDVTIKDLKRAVAEGFDSIELAKRYTTVTMGPCQGKLCSLNSTRLLAGLTDTPEAEVGTTTARPPWAPVSMGLLAGRPHEPAKLTSIHHAHADAGAKVMWTGAWRRPHSYGDPEAEAKSVHDSLGLIDVSTLGKLVLRGPDAGAFLDRLYPNRFSDLAAGRIRYGVLGSDAGRIMDDGTIARLDDETFYVTTTSTGADTVVEWFEWWNAVWHMDVETTNVTGALAAVNVAGPQARELLGRLTGLDVSPEGFRYLDAKEASVAGVPSLLLRIGFVGELGYEIHVPSPYGEYLWETILAEGADLAIRPFGLEPQRILRLEKMHILVGQDTDSESNAFEASMPWIVKLDKEDFVGKRSLELVRERGLRDRLVGFEMVDGIGAVPAEGGQIVIKGRPGGRVTSSRFSPELGRAVGMAWVPAELARDGAELVIKMDGGVAKANVRLNPFFDPEGAKLRS